MQRHPFKKRRIVTKLKHRLKLNAKYDPRSRIRVTFTETISKPLQDLFDQWARVVMA